MALMASAAFSALPSCMSPIMTLTVTTPMIRPNSILQQEKQQQWQQHQQWQHRPAAVAARRQKSAGRAASILCGDVRCDTRMRGTHHSCNPATTTAAASRMKMSTLLSCAHSLAKKPGFFGGVSALGP